MKWVYDGIEMAAYDEENGELTVFVINRDWEETAEFTLDITGLDGYRFEGHYQMFTEEAGVQNTYEDPDRLAPVRNEETRAEGTKVEAVLEKLSWNVFRFVKAE